MSKSGRFAPDFMIMQRRKEEEYRRTFEEKVKTDGSIGRVAHWEHKTANKCACPLPPAPASVLLPHAPALLPRAELHSRATGIQASPRRLLAADAARHAALPPAQRVPPRLPPG